MLLYPEVSNYDNSTSAIGIDTADKIGDGLFYLLLKPKIEVIGKPFKLFVGFLIGICSFITFVMFCLIIQYRNHTVMTIAQAGLLGWLCATALVVITFSFLFLPTRTAFCKISYLLFIPATMLPAIMIGRLWRVYATLEAANRVGRLRFNNMSDTSAQKKLFEKHRDKEYWLMNFLSSIAFIRFPVCEGNTIKCRRKKEIGPRRTTSWKDTLRLVIVLISPQIILQVFYLAYYQTYVHLQLSVDYKVASQGCYRDGMEWVFYVGYVLRSHVLFGILYRLVFLQHTICVQ